jgi:hypothetical protein
VGDREVREACDILEEVCAITETLPRDILFRRRPRDVEVRRIFVYCLYHLRAPAVSFPSIAEWFWEMRGREGSRTNHSTYSALYRNVDLAQAKEVLCLLKSTPKKK